MSYLAIKLEEAREALFDAERRADAAEEALARCAEHAERLRDVARCGGKLDYYADELEDIADAIEAEAYPQEDRT